MRKLIFGGSLVVALLVGVAALLVTTLVHPAQARADSRQLASVQSLARQVTERLDILPGTGATPASCRFSGLTDCRTFADELPALVIRVTSIEQDVTGRPAEIQCFSHHPRDLDVYGRGKATGVSDCMVIERFNANKHMIMIDIRNPSASGDNPAGAIAGMQVD